MLEVSRAMVTNDYCSIKTLGLNMLKGASQEVGPKMDCRDN